MKHILDLDRNLVVSRPENHYHDVLILKKFKSMGNIYNSCRLPLRMKLAGMLLMGSISMGYGITERRQSASLFIEVNNESVQNVLKEIESQSEYSFFMIIKK